MKKIQKFDLTSLVKPLDAAARDSMSVAAFKRILESESEFGAEFRNGISKRFSSELVSKGAAGQARTKLIVTLVTMFGDDFSKCKEGLSSKHPLPDL